MIIAYPVESEQGVPLRSDRSPGKSRANLGIKNKKWGNAAKAEELPLVTWVKQGREPGGPALEFAPITSLLQGFWSVLPGLQDAPGCGCQMEGRESLGWAQSQGQARLNLPAPGQAPQKCAHSTLHFDRHHEADGRC